MHIINLDDKKVKQTHGVSLFIDKSTTVHSDSFEYKYIPQELLKKIKDQSIKDQQI